MSQLTVVKIGGNIIDDPESLALFLKDFAAVGGVKILAHGGGKIATEIGKKTGLEPHYVDGRRITDAPTLDLVTMVYGGLVNKQVVAALQATGCNAIGLTGADGNVIQATKRPVKEVDYGFVGDIAEEGVNSSFLHYLLEAGLTPVLSPLTHDGRGTMLNTNADTIAGEVAKALSGLYAVQLIYCFEKPGVLADASDDASVIRSLRADDFAALKDKKIISDGMIPKLQNAFEAISRGVGRVIIGHAGSLPELISGHAGTIIQ